MTPSLSRGWWGKVVGMLHVSFPMKKYRHAPPNLKYLCDYQTIAFRVRFLTLLCSWKDIYNFGPEIILNIGSVQSFAVLKYKNYCNWLKLTKVGND